MRIRDPEWKKIGSGITARKAKMTDQGDEWLIREMGC
jgi:hypothetical protein